MNRGLRIEDTPLFISQCRIKIVNDRADGNDKLFAFATVTFDDCFVVRDLKVVGGARGAFVAMPSRRITDRCPRCGAKNHLRARYCNDCAAQLDDNRAPSDALGHRYLHSDIVHPVTSECRTGIQEDVFAAYREELERSKLPGYRCTYDSAGPVVSGTAKTRESDMVAPLSARINRRTGT